MKRYKKYLFVILLVTSNILGSIFGCDAQRMVSAEEMVVVQSAALSTTKQSTKGSEIQSTVKEGKLTIDSVKHIATQLNWYPLPGIYSQVVDGHYYYMRQTEWGYSNGYTMYRDKGKKVGLFHYTEESPWWVYDWHAFGWHEGKLYVEFIDEDEHKIKLGVVDFKKKSIKAICTCTLPAAFDIINTDVYLYQDKIYAMDKDERKVKEFDMSSGNLLNTFSLPKSGKNEEIYFICIADGKIYYAVEQRKGKKLVVTMHYRDMAGNKDKKILRFKVSRESDWGYLQENNDLIVITKGEIYDAYNNKYYFYIDKKYRLHRKNRKTGKDKIISGIKAVTVDCTKKGLYVQKYDKWYDDGFYEDAHADYAPALYFMDFKGGNVKKIAKYTRGTME